MRTRTNIHAPMVILMEFSPPRAEMLGRASPRSQDEQQIKSAVRQFLPWTSAAATESSRRTSIRRTESRRVTLLDDLEMRPCLHPVDAGKGPDGVEKLDELAGRECPHRRQQIEAS